MIVSSKLAGITPIVRIPELQYGLCSRLLDQGAQGIILPRVEEPRSLELALSWLRFPPVGQRGYGVNATMVEYETPSMVEVIEHQNSQILAVVQFETTAALDRADELLSLRGVDVVMVGPSDLSISLGLPGQVEHPTLINAVERLIEKCNHYGVVPGIQTRGVAMAKAWAERGMRFVGVAAEHVLLLEKARETVSELRSAPVV
jgi:2-dehydro-3-deoxyglucarate aldolase/4-hydroxy-2-oxoheptanedioate aldolase